MIGRLASLAGALALVAAGPPPFGPSRTFSGIYSSSFEHSEFGGCWLSFAPKASKRFFSIVPPETHWGRRYHVEFIGRTTPRRDVRGGKGYGHLGTLPCEIEVTEVKAARILKPSGR